jgi:hypothetical protein
VRHRARLDADAAAAAHLAREVSLELAPGEIESALTVRERNTARAREGLVSGVPAFMLGAWPFACMQSEATLLHAFERYARRAREEDLQERGS